MKYVIYMCTCSCLVRVLVQFSLKNSQVTFLLVAVESESEFLRPRWNFRGQQKECLGGGFKHCSDSWIIVDDLPGSSVACHSSLRCSFICAHLQADDISAFGQLFLWEISPVLLGLPAPMQTHTHLSPQSLFTVRLAHILGAVKHSNLLMEPARVSFVTPIILCDSQTTQSHQGPLDSSQILACRHATISHEQSKHTKYRKRPWPLLSTTEYSFVSLLISGKQLTTPCCNNADKFYWLLTFKEVYSLKHVSFGDSIVFCSFKEHGYLFHLLKCHAGTLDGLDRLVRSGQAVDELTKQLDTRGRSRSL